MKFTLTVQLPDGAMLAPDVQVLLITPNSALLTDVAPNTKAAVPVLVRVIDWPLAVAPTFEEPNERVLADNEAVGVPTTTATPVPERLTPLLAGVALCAMVSDPESAPAEAGLNVTDTEQLPPTAMLVPFAQVLEATAKLPVTDVAPSTSAAVPVLLSVTDCAEEVDPTLVDAKVSDGTDSVATGAVTTTAIPVPESETTLVAGVALCEIVIDPDLAPAAVGVKLAVTEQLDPTAMLAPAVHVLAESAKSAPDIAVDAITSAAVPELVSVAVWVAAADPTVVDGKLNVAAESVAAGAPAVQLTVGLAM